MEMYKSFGVNVAIKKDGKFLLVKRADNDTSPGLWEFPGGKAESEENSEHATIRETKEETNLDLKNVKQLCEYDRMMRNGKMVIHVVLLYCDSFSGKVKLSDEHSAYKWLTEKEIKSLENVAMDVGKFFELRKSHKI